jgi:type II secretory ATPase GspE/PulE/Tfp pilus assembly ATPase PilB-like protein
VRPTLWGETIVMRLVDKSGLILDMTKLGSRRTRLSALETRSPSLTGSCC